MSIASVISSIETNLSNAYGVINTKGGTIPANKNLTNLANAINSIPAGGGAVDNNPFYFTSASAFTVKLNLSDADSTGVMQYSTNGSTWNTYTSETSISGSANEKVYFRGTGFTVISGNVTTSRFTLTGTTTIYVSGNILRLLDYAKVENGNSIGISIYKYCFAYLFYNNALLDIDSNFVLPSGTMSSYCYYSMFRGCTSLTTAPSLPATALSTYCYYSMFHGCTSLTTAPALPATALDTYCYYRMFQGCTSLTTAPALPATTLAPDCYYNMFYGCTSLTAAPNLPATTLTTYCYCNMFQNCTSLTVAPNLPATTLNTYCYYNMFQSCTSLTIPAIIGDGITSYTYKSCAMQNMYYNCSSLHIYTSNQGNSTTFFKGLTATTSNSMSSMFYNCYIDGTQQTTGTGVAGQQYYY